jgi:hypothetical protein
MAWIGEGAKVPEDKVTLDIRLNTRPLRK